MCIYACVCVCVCVKRSTTKLHNITLPSQVVQPSIMLNMAMALDLSTLMKSNVLDWSQMYWIVYTMEQLSSPSVIILRMPEFID